MNTLILILLVILFCVLFIWIGYTISILIHKPKELKDIIHNLQDDNIDLKDVNDELSDNIKRFDETIKSNTNWYLQNINALGQYLKDKYNDNYVFDQLRNIPGIIPQTNNNYNVDDLLDKLSIGGWDALTLEEINYLKNQRDIK